MPVVRLDHFNLAPRDSQATVRFYEDIVGLKVGARPDFGIDGYWLYAGAQPVLHILDNPKRPGGPTGKIDHVAFYATDLASYVERLKAGGYSYVLQTVEVADMHQLFVTDPDGVTLEIGFPLAEAVPEDAGRTFFKSGVFDTSKAAR
jgi:catechol 2,3-dioxygenase-like lactoylglutathione lyase family enzyme